MDDLRGKMLDGQPTLFFGRTPPGAGYAIDASDHGRLYRNGEVIGECLQLTYDRDVAGWWIHYEALPTSQLDPRWMAPADSPAGLALRRELGH